VALVHAENTILTGKILPVLVSFQHMVLVIMVLGMSWECDVFCEMVNKWFQRINDPGLSLLLLLDINKLSPWSIHPGQEVSTVSSQEWDHSLNLALPSGINSPYCIVLSIPSLLWKIP
jgi:hypothetical protein